MTRECQGASTTPAAANTEVRMKMDATFALGYPMRRSRGPPRGYRAIEQRIHSGIAFACLAADCQDADKIRIEGSPSFVLDEGRQKLYGNVEFPLLEASIQELLRVPRTDEASWC